MKSAIFYLLNCENIQNSNNVDGIEKLVCNIAAENWRIGKRIFIHCENKQQAILLNDTLWIEPPESFIPHNLIEKHSRGITPIEIGWLNKCDSSKYDILISLRTSFFKAITSFKEVIDFIPNKESLKALARIRYKAYKIAGFNIKIITWK